MADDVVASDPKGVARAEMSRVAASGARGSKREGGTGKAVLTPAQVQLRDTAIVAAAHAGIPAKEIAKSFEISGRSVGRIVAGYRERRTPLDQRPMEVVEDSLRAYRAQIADALRMAGELAWEAPAVAVAWAKLAADARERMLALLADVGALPSALATFRAEAELARLAELTLDTLRRVAAGELSAQEAVTVVEDAVLADEPLPVVEGREA